MHPSDGRVVSNFIMQALRGEVITVYGDGEQTPSFCYVDDLIEGFVRLMATSDKVTGPINLGNPREFIIRRLADLTSALTGSRSKIVSHPLPHDDPRQRPPDIELAKATLDWSPTTPLEEGLAKTIAYFEGLLREAASAGRFTTDCALVSSARVHIKADAEKSWNPQHVGRGRERRNRWRLGIAHGGGHAPPAPTEPRLRLRRRSGRVGRPA
jgi:hypothetical protein